MIVTTSKMEAGVLQEMGGMGNNLILNQPKLNRYGSKEDLQ